MQSVIPKLRKNSYQLHCQCNLLSPNFERILTSYIANAICYPQISKEFLPVTLPMQSVIPKLRKNSYQLHCQCNLLSPNFERILTSYIANAICYPQTSKEFLPVTLPMQSVIPNFERILTSYIANAICYPQTSKEFLPVTLPMQSVIPKLRKNSYQLHCQCNLLSPNFKHTNFLQKRIIKQIQIQFIVEFNISFQPFWFLSFINKYSFKDHIRDHPFPASPSTAYYFVMRFVASYSPGVNHYYLGILCGSVCSV